MSRRLDAVSQWSILLLCGLLPFFFAPVSWITIAQSKMALVAVLLFVGAVSWFFARILEGRVRIPVSLVLIAAALVPLAYAISAAVSGFTSFSLLGSGVEQDTLASACIWYGVLALSAVVFANSPTHVARALQALFAGALVLELFQITHFLFPALPLGSALSASVGNALGSWHEFAVALGFFAFLGLALMQGESRDRISRCLFSAVALLALLLLVVADFFDVWAALAFFAFVFFLYRAFISPDIEAAAPFLRRPVLWIGVALVSLFFVVFGSFISNILPASLQVVGGEVRPSWAGTLQIGQQALTSPLTLFFGAGPNTFTREWSLYKPAGVNQTPFWGVDFSAGVGSIPTSFITIGIIGVLAWILFIAALLWKVSMLLLARRGGRSMLEPLALSSVFLIAFHVLSVPGPALNALTFLVIGLLVARAAGEGRLRIYEWEPFFGGWRGIASTAAVSICSLAVILASVGAARALAAEMLLNRSIVLYNDSQDTIRSSKLIDTALLIYPSDDRIHRAAVQLGLAQLQQLAASSSSAQTRAQLQSTLQATISQALQAVSLDSGDYQNWLQLASLYQQLAGAKVQGAYDNARAAYQKAAAQNPTSPMPLLQLAQLEVVEDHPDTALQYLANAVQLKPDLADAYYLASQIYASKNDFKNAAAAAQASVQYARSDPLAWYNLGAILYGAADYTNAAAAEAQALALNPQYANALYIEGLAYWQLKRPDLALQAFTALDKLDPGQAIVAQIIAELKAGKAPPRAPGT